MPVVTEETATVWRNSDGVEHRSKQAAYEREVILIVDDAVERGYKFSPPDGVDIGEWGPRVEERLARLLMHWDDLERETVVTPPDENLAALFDTRDPQWPDDCSIISVPSREFAERLAAERGWDLDAVFPVSCMVGGLPDNLSDHCGELEEKAIREEIMRCQSSE